jgi:hypothetical protein
LNLGGVGVDGHRRAVFGDEMNAVAGQPRGEQRLNFVECIIGGERAEVRFGGAGELEKVVDDAFEAGEFTFDDEGVGMFRRARAKTFVLNEKGGFQSSEWSADFVSDAGRQETEGSEFFVALNQSLAFDQFGAQRSDQVAKDQHCEHGAEDKEQGDESENGDAKLRECFIGLGKNGVARFVMGTGKFLSQIVEMAGLILETVVFDKRSAGFLGCLHALMDVPCFLQISFASGLHLI